MDKENKNTQQAATPAARLGLPERITKQEINELPLARFPGRIHLVTTAAAVELMLERLSSYSVLGFDTESRPSFRKGDNFPPTVVQFANADDAYIVQIGRLGGLDGIRPLLENPKVLKVGVALHDDIKRLKEVGDFEPG